MTKLEFFTALAFLAAILLLGFGSGEEKAIGACILAYLHGREDGRRDVPASPLDETRRQEPNA